MQVVKGGSSLNNSYPRIACNGGAVLHQDGRRLPKGSLADVERLERKIIEADSLKSTLYQVERMLNVMHEHGGMSEKQEARLGSILELIKRNPWRRLGQR